MPTLLYLANYYYPPTAAPEIRAARLTAALVGAGWRVLVITTTPTAEIKHIHPNLTVYCLTDRGEMPEGTGVSAGNESDARFRYCSDANEAMLTGCDRLARHLLAQEPVDLIFSTGPYFSVNKVAQLLADEFRKPWIMELRDAWHTGMVWPYPTRRHRQAAQEWERDCVDRADRIITVTQTHRTLLETAYGSAVTTKIATVRHSFDRSSAPPAVSHSLHAKPGHFRIIHTGQLRGIDICSSGRFVHWVSQTSRLIRRWIRGASFCEKLRIEWMSPHLTLAAAGRLARENPDFAREVLIEFAGASYPQVDRWARQFGLADRVVQHGFLPSRQSQALVAQADLLLMYLYGIDGMARHWCVPTKLYTYLSTGKPILAPIPPGEAVELLNQSGLGVVVPPWNEEAVYQALKTLYRQHQAGGIQVQPNQAFIDQFDVTHQQKAFMAVVNSVSILQAPANLTMDE